MVAISWFLIHWMMPASFTFTDVLYGVERTVTADGLFWASTVGLLAGVAIGYLTEHCCQGGVCEANESTRACASC